jgi:hypothetical protein
MARKRIGALLAEKGYITEFQLVAALSHQRKWKNKLGQSLIELGYLQEEQLYECLADQLGIGLVDMRRTEISPDLLRRVDKEFVKEWLAIPVGFDGTSFIVAAAEQDKPNLQATLEAKLGGSVILALATTADIEAKLRKIPEKTQVATVKPMKKAFLRDQNGDIKPVDDEPPTKIHANVASGLGETDLPLSDDIFLTAPVPADPAPAAPRPSAPKPAAPPAPAKPAAPLPDLPPLEDDISFLEAQPAPPAPLPAPFEMAPPPGEAVVEQDIELFTEPPGASEEMELELEEPVDQSIAPSEDMEIQLESAHESAAAIPTGLPASISEDELLPSLDDGPPLEDLVQPADADLFDSPPVESAEPEISVPPAPIEEAPPLDLAPPSTPAADEGPPNFDLPPLEQPSAPSPSDSTFPDDGVVAVPDFEAPAEDEAPLEAPPLEAPSFEAPSLEAPPLDEPLVPPLEAPPEDIITDQAQPPAEDEIIAMPDLEAPPLEAPSLEAPSLEAPSLEAPSLEAPSLDAPPLEAEVPAEGADPWAEPSSDASPPDLQTPAPPGDDIWAEPATPGPVPDDILPSEIITDDNGLEPPPLAGPESDSAPVDLPALDKIFDDEEPQPPAETESAPDLGLPPLIDLAPPSSPPDEAPQLEPPSLEPPPLEEAPPMDALLADSPFEPPPLEEESTELPPLEAPSLEAPSIDIPLLEIPSLDAPPLEAPSLEAPSLEPPPLDLEAEPSAPPDLQPPDSGLDMPELTEPAPSLDAATAPDEPAGADDAFGQIIDVEEQPPAAAEAASELPIAEPAPPIAEPAIAAPASPPAAARDEDTDALMSKIAALEQQIQSLTNTLDTVKDILKEKPPRK